MRKEPSVRLLKRLLSYCSDTGRLKWKERPVWMFSAPDVKRRKVVARIWNTRQAGASALSTDNGNGYLVGRLFDRLTLAHRVAWAMHHGAWPKGYVDHINQDPSDNRIENLRLVSKSGNAKNMRLSAANTSGVTGVVWHKASGKWAARIRVDYKSRHLGLFESFEEAVAARKAAEIEHGFHPNHGRAA